jgi:hypothetical protein
MAKKATLKRYFKEPKNYLMVELNTVIMEVSRVENRSKKRSKVKKVATLRKDLESNNMLSNNDGKTPLRNNLYEIKN